MNTYELAIKLENDAAAFYEQQAESNKGLRTEKLFRELAAVENKHAATIRQFIDQHTLKLDLGLAEANEASAIYTKASDFVSEVRDVPSTREIYRQAQALEQKSIDLYQDLLQQAEARSPEAAEADLRLLKWLISQEEAHEQLFKDLAELLDRSEEHVEAAEFANPPEY
ncbi:MAG: ferritin family protein [Oscillospiraceae bacterium]|nr:ferritin family protein [Oscillospiraceae bacterium]MDD4368818.1 ferritin family protein [Oscillospiraceae bacterium]